MKAILNKSEFTSKVYNSTGKSITIEHNTKYDFKYDKEDNFFIVVDGVEYEECSTAFNFINN